MSDSVRSLTPREKLGLNQRGRYVRHYGTRTIFVGEFTGLNGELLYIFALPQLQGQFSYQLLDYAELGQQIFKKRKYRPESLAKRKLC
jgi:hypothetical protein